MSGEVSCREKSELIKNSLFSGLEEEELKKALTFFFAERASYKKGEVMHVIGSGMEHFGIVISGSVNVLTEDIDGNSVMMANVGPGETFGESMCYLKLKEAYAHIYAAENTELFWLKTDNVGTDSEFTGRFTAMLAKRTLIMNDRIQILSKLSIESKLLTYFGQCERRYGGSEFEIPMGREDLAVYLGTNRSALSRELSKMKSFGLIEISGRKIKILKDTEKADDIE